jgi:hypothetical protein
MRVRDDTTGANPRRPRSIALWLSLAVVVASCSCDDEGTTGSLTLRVALNAMEVDPDGCGGERFEGLPRSLPPSWSCVRLEIDGADGPVAIAPTADEHGVLEPGPAIVRWDMNAGFAVDVRGSSPPYSIRATLFDDLGAAVGHGELRGVQLERELTLPIYQHNQANCAGLELAPRALHRMVRVPGGDVVILGGVRGFAHGFTLDRQEGFVPQSQIEIYHAADHSLTRVPAEVSYAGVMFDVVEEGLSAGVYRFRTVGGFGAMGEGAVLGLDPSQFNSISAGPVIPRSEARAPAPEVVFEYDTARRALRIVSSSTPDMEEWTGTTAAAAPIGRSAVAIGGVIDAKVGQSGSLSNHPVFFSEASDPDLLRVVRFDLDALDSRTTVSGVGAPRFGATVTRLPDRSGWLIWGGNVLNTVLDATVLDRAGAFIPVSEGSTPRALTVSGVTTAAEVPAFHSADQVGDWIVSAGGLRIACDSCIDDQYASIGNESVSGPLRRMRVTDSTLVTEPLSGTFEPSIFHAATHLVETGSSDVIDANRWLVTGGAVREAATMDRLASLRPSSQLVLVTYSAVDGAHTVEALPVAGGLIEPRWGHAAVPLDDGRVLITGGFRRVRVHDDAEPRPPGEEGFQRCLRRESNADCFEALASGEIVSYGQSPELVQSDDRLTDDQIMACVGGSAPVDAGLPSDAGSVADAGSAADAGSGDAGSPLDAGL